MGLAAAEINGNIIVTGGTTNGSDALYTTAKYDPETDSWGIGATMSYGRRFHGMVNLNGWLYVIGGEDGMGNELTGMDIQERGNGDSWTKVNLVTPEYRTRFGAAVLSNFIYAVGGRQTGITTDNVGYWEVTYVDWMGASNMMAKREGVGVAARNGRIYAVGGFDDFGAAMSSGESLDSPTGFWSSISNMKQVRAYHAVATWNGRIYAIGGISSPMGSPSSSVEAFNPDNGNWDDETPFPIPIAKAAAVVVGNRLFVVGGESTDGKQNRLFEAIRVNSDAVKSGGIKAMPNTMTMGDSTSRIRIIVKGDPNKRSNLYFWSLAGRKVGQVEVETDSNGVAFVEPKLFSNDMHLIAGTFIVTGDKNSGVTGRCAIMLLPKGQSK